jgi:cyclopropane-fatty-acyl-phospholipid synthase
VKAFTLVEVAMTTNANIDNLAKTPAKKVLFKLMKSLRRGQIDLTTPEGQHFHFQGNLPGTCAQLKINDWKLLDALFSRGDIGFGEAYRDGLCDSKDMAKVILLAIENEDVFKKVIVGSAASLLPYIIKHKINRNTVKGSQKNIEAHYDLGNDFYKLWLDETMTYSSAYFEKDKVSLKEAQLAKYDEILSGLKDLPDQSKILEVGCGWGGFMKRALEKRHFKVFGLTLSKEQKRFIEEKGCGEVILQDYRNHKGLYDGIVSIEMFEALGKEYWSTYFKKISSLLKVGSPAVIQTITMNEHDFKAYKKGTDFIQQYIFPGGMLPSVELFTKLARKAGLRLMKSQSFGQSYAKTLELWEESFSAVEDKVLALGFDQSFIRLWRFYLKYCQGAFESGKINVYQFTLQKM